MNHMDTDTKKDAADRKEIVVILVAEDDLFLRKLLADELKTQGFSVVEADDGEAALKSMHETRPHLLVLDLLMPGIDGFGVLKRIRENKDLEKIPVVILTNLSQQDDLERAKSFGIEEYLVKSDYSLEDLVFHIRAILDKKYLRLG